MKLRDTLASALYFGRPAGARRVLDPTLLLSRQRATADKNVQNPRQQASSDGPAWAMSLLRPGPAARPQTDPTGRAICLRVGSLGPSGWASTRLALKWQGRRTA